MKPDAMLGWQEEEKMNTNNEAMKALDKIKNDSGGLAGKIFAPEFETIRTALIKSAQVDGLVDALNGICSQLELMSYSAAGDQYDLSKWCAIEAGKIKKALQQFSAKEI